MDLGKKREFMFETVQNRIVMINKSQIEFYAFLYTWIAEALGNSYFDSVAFPCDPSHIGKVILVIGVLDMGNELSPFSCEVSATPESRKLSGVDLISGNCGGGRWFSECIALDKFDE